MKKYLLLITISLYFVSCEKFEKKPFADAENGTTTICVDETYKPIIEEQAYVFGNRFPNAKLIIEYKAEDKCWEDLDNDSIDMIITTKKLNTQELEFFKKKYGYYYQQDKLAYDAIAIIVNKAIKDTVFSLQKVEELLQGKVYQDKFLVVDGQSATSTYRYLKDSILRGKPFGKSIRGVSGSQEVIDLVSNNPKYIGFIGLSWIGNPDNPKHLEYQKKVNLINVQSKINKDIFAKPTADNIITGKYPYYRQLTYVNKKNYTTVSSGFINFMQYERGQLIFKRAYLVPAKMNFEIRQINYKEKAK